MDNTICKHEWQREPDYWWCKKCRATKRIVNGVPKCWNKDGKLMSLIEDGGEEEVAEAEVILKELKKKRS